MENSYIVKKIKGIDTDNFVMNPADLRDYFEELAEFNLKRFYFVNEIKGNKETGQHAHTDEDGIFIILQGNAVMLLDDDGSKKDKINVRTGNIVWVPRYVWHGFVQMSEDFIVLILSNKNYDEERKGYIEDYSKFKNLINK